MALAFHCLTGTVCNVGVFSPVRGLAVAKERSQRRREICTAVPQSTFSRLSGSAAEKACCELRAGQCGGTRTELSGIPASPSVAGRLQPRDVAPSPIVCTELLPQRAAWAWSKATRPACAEGRIGSGERGASFLPARRIRWLHGKGWARRRRERVFGSGRPRLCFGREMRGRGAT